MHKRSRKVRVVPTSLAQVILRLTVCKFKFSAMLRELKIISGKNLLFYSNSLSNILTFAFQFKLHSAVSLLTACLSMAKAYFNS